MKELKLGKRRIGPGRPVFIIAEIGSNHNQDIRQAYKLIDAAADAGADAVKFQSLQFSELYPPDAPEAMRRLYSLIKLDYSWYPKIFARARRRGMVPFSCPTSLESIGHLERAGAALYKIASPQTLAFPQVVLAAASTGKPVIVSTGYCDDARIARAVGIFRGRKAGMALLHCNAQYPAPPDIVGLGEIARLADAHRVPVGFSDHTMGPHFAVAAVALGACVIEKHLTLNRRGKGPDHRFAAEPREFAEMVRQIRELERGLAPRKILGAGEIAVGRTMRMAVYAGRDIAAGADVRPSVRFLRSQKGLSAERFFTLSKPRAKRAIRAGEPIAEGLLRS